MAERDRLADLRIDRSEGRSGEPRSIRMWLVGAAVVVVALAAWWMFASGGLPVVSTAQVSVGTGSAGGTSVLDASGYVVARRRATVASKVTGLLKEVSVEEGMKVEEGQVLARLDDSNARRALELAQANVAVKRADRGEIEARLRKAELDLGRMRALDAEGIVSRAELDVALAARDATAAQLEAAKGEITVTEREVAARAQDVEDTLVRAPFAGMAVSKDAQPGEIVSPMSAGGGFTRTGIGTIVDMTSLEIEVDVNEAFIQRVLPDQPVVATLGAYPDWQIPAKVITTVPTADRQKATVKVRIGFDQLGDPRILPDMGVKVAFQAEAKPDAVGAAKSLVVPKKAVRQDGKNGVVFVLRGEEVERRAVSLGNASGDPVEVLSGLRAGDTVVLDPPADLADGDRVARKETR